MEPPQRLTKKLDRYKPGGEVAELVNSVPTLLLVGISGAGKDTVKHLLLESNEYHHIVSHTTRVPRKNHGVMEVDGVDYHFIDYQTAEHMLDNQGYVEAKCYGNNIYGTSVGEFRLSRDEQKIAVTDLEVQGVTEYMKLAPDGVRPVFLLPPTFDIWQDRLRQRYGHDHQDHSDDITRRLHTAEAELAHLLETDYFFAVVNNDLNNTIATVDAIAKQGIEDKAAKQEALRIADDILKRLRQELSTLDS